MLKKVAFKVFYLGTAYHGFQMQPNHNSVEEEIKKSLIAGKYIKDYDSGNFAYSSRTDSGVHALEQIIYLETDKKIIIPEINQNLPEDIIFWGFKTLEKEFIPRYEVLSRHYKYIFAKDYRNYDLDMMKKAATLFIGTHDFTNFAKIRKKRNPNREILKFEIRDIDNCYIFDVIGISFLHQMVRRIVKSILDLGLSKITLDNIEELLDTSKIPVHKIGPAPLEPRGSLILYEIKNNLNFEIDPYSYEKMKRFFTQKIAEFSLRKKSFELFLDLITKEKDV